MKKITILFISLALYWNVSNACGENSAPPPTSQLTLEEQIKKLQQMVAAYNKESKTTSGNKDANISVDAPKQISEPKFPVEPVAAATASSQLTQQIVPQKVASQDVSQAANINTMQTTSGTDFANNELTDQAFSGVVSQLLPMTPDQIAKLRQVFDTTQLAASTPAGEPPKPTTTSIVVNLSPQAAPPIIRLGAGYITSLVFVDSTGQPWPIEAYSIGDPTAFNIQWDRKGNTLLVQSASFYKRSNLAVILKELNTPVMITLLAGQRAIDYRVDLRIPGTGPNAMLVQNGLPDAPNPELLNVLNGVPPKGGKKLRVSGGDCEGWVVNNKLYLRTRLNVISPAWRTIMTSIDGTHAYEMQQAPVILALQRGKDKTISLTIEGME